MIRIVRILAILILVLPAAFGRSVAAQESRVWIEGTSNVNSFTCTSDDVDGQGLVAGARPRGIEVTIDTLDCGNGRMNADMRKALDSDVHPTIRFDVARVAVLEPGAEQFRIRVDGSLEIAGEERGVSVEMDGRRAGGDQIRTTGSTALDLSDFGIDPPRAMMGLVRVRDRVVVHFDLVESGAVVPALAEWAGEATEL